MCQKRKVKPHVHAPECTFSRDPRSSRSQVKVPRELIKCEIMLALSSEYYKTWFHNDWHFITKVSCGMVLKVKAMKSITTMLG